MDQKDVCSSEGIFESLVSSELKMPPYSRTTLFTVSVEWVTELPRPRGALGQCEFCQRCRLPRQSHTSVHPLTRVMSTLLFRKPRKTKQASQSGRSLRGQA